MTFSRKESTIGIIMSDRENGIQRPANSRQRSLSEMGITQTAGWLESLTPDNTSLTQARVEVEGLISQRNFVDALGKTQTFFNEQVGTLKSEGVDEEIVNRITATNDLLTSLAVSSLEELFSAHDINAILGGVEYKGTTYDKVSPKKNFESRYQGILSGVLELTQFAKKDKSSKLSQYGYVVDPVIKFIVDAYKGDSSAQAFSDHIGKTLFPTMLLLKLVSDKATIAVDDARMAGKDDSAERSTESGKLVQFCRDNQIVSPVEALGEIFFRATYPYQR